MASYMQPRSNLGGIARQPFRPGQWQGFKGVSRNTTYIQNNFYGSSVFGANRNYGYYTPQPSYHDCGNNDMPKWMKWMVGLGVGSSLLGGILKLFQKDKPEGGGDVQEPVQTSTPAPVEAPTQAPAQEVSESPETPTGTPTPAEGGDGVKADYAGLNSLNSMVCRDDSGKTTNIEGNFKITEAGANGEPPKSFTITDSSSGTAHEYTYEYCITSSDCRQATNHIAIDYALDGTNTTLLVLDYSLSLDKEVPYLDIARTYRSIFEDYTKLAYQINGKTYYYDVSIANPSNYDEKAVIKVPRVMETADSIELILTIRNISYHIKLK